METIGDRLRILHRGLLLLCLLFLHLGLLALRQHALLLVGGLAVHQQDGAAEAYAGGHNHRHHTRHVNTYR